MKSKKPSVLRIYAFSTIVSIILLTIAGVEKGLSALLLVMALAALEVSLSFDNAVVNAKILQRMSDGWRKAFLSIGIIIAVFGVRLILPVFLVAIAVGTSFGDVVDLALHHPEEYGHELEKAHLMIASFGGSFLLMIFLDFFFTRRDTRWIKPLEKLLHKIGEAKNIAPILTATGILIASQLVDEHEQYTVVTAGLIGMLLYMAIHSLDDLLQRSGMEEGIGRSGSAAFKAGLLGFIYLEVIDASFSLDGVVGAFAITSDILLIGIGLGIGALFVRTITVHMLQRGVLDTYKYIEHGAHYAIGVLALIMLISLKTEIPEVVTGLAGLVIIIASVIHSVVDNRRALRA